MNSDVIVLDAPRATLCGSAAVLLDAEGPLTLPTQERIWKLAERVRDWEGVTDQQPGMNNLLVLVDPLVADAEALRARLLAEWARIEPGWAAGRLLEMAAIYGGEGGPDLVSVAQHHGVDPEQVALLHAAPDYVVFAPAVAPGFGYLFGLDPKLFTPRRDVPVMRSGHGSVSIGGAQAMLGNPRRVDRPGAIPTGWHAIGQVPDVPQPFDLSRDPVNLLSLGDRIRFRVERVLR